MLLSANYDASRIVDTREAVGLVSELDHGRSPPATAEHRRHRGEEGSSRTSGHMNDPAFPLEPHAFSPTARSERPGSVALLMPTFLSLVGAIVGARGFMGNPPTQKFSQLTSQLGLDRYPSDTKRSSENEKTNIVDQTYNPIGSTRAPICRFSSRRRTGLGRRHYRVMGRGSSRGHPL
jgi:hypothetical protein